MQKEEPDTISDAKLEAEEFLLIHIGDQRSQKTISNDEVRTKDSEIWFFQVSDVAELTYEPYTIRGQDGTERVPLDPGEGLNYQRFWDSNGDDILRVEDESWRVYHYSVGIKQDYVRIYPRIPDNQNGGAWDWLSGSQPDPTSGDPYGYFTGSDTDFDDPTIALEAVTWENDARSPMQYGYYNEHTQLRVRPKISITGFAYDLRPVVQEDKKLNLLADAMRPQYNRQSSLRTVEFSRAALRTFGFSVPDDWRDTQNNFNISMANLPEDIEAELDPDDDEDDSDSASDAVEEVISND